MNQALRDLYYDETTGYTGLVKLFKRAKEDDPTITLSDVRAFLDKQYTHQINREGIRPKHYRTILAQKPRDNFQVDIMVYNRFADGPYEYILNIVDVHSRYAMSIPLKSRKIEGDDDDNLNMDDVDGVLPALRKAFAVMGKPKNVNADQEFSRPLALQRYFNDENITMHISDTNEINKQAIVERYNRTLALLLRRWREGSKRKDWHRVLDDLVKNYNTSYHRGIKAKPKDVWEGRAENKQSPIHVFEAELEVGDLVRRKLIKEIFDKGDALKYSEEVYVITDKKDGVEAGKKLKKFRIKDVKKNRILDKPREWWKDYELKKVDAIVETKDSSEDLTEKKAVAVEDEAEKKAKKAKKAEERKETLKALAGAEVVDSQEYRELVSGKKGMKEAIEALKLKDKVGMEAREKMLGMTNQQVLRNYATQVLGFKNSQKNLENGNLMNRLRYNASVGRFTEKPLAKLREDILKVEVKRGLVVVE